MIAFFLRFIENKLQPPMKMDDFDIIDVFRFAIARVSHIADYLSGRHYAALLQIFAIREILAQVGFPSKLRMPSRQPPYWFHPMAST